MGLEKLTDPHAIVQAMAEYDEIGGPEFRARYGFLPSKRYVIRYEESLYDSKPILAAAYGLQYPEEGPLGPNDFAGGWSTTRRKLIDLGFEVVDKRARPVHLLLKWNAEDDPDTIEKHLATAEANDGHVWWGNFTQGQRKAAISQVNRIRDQIKAGIPTYGYLYRLGKRPAVLRARIEAVTIDRREVDEARIPSYYSPEQRHSIYVLLTDFQPVDVSWVQAHLVQATNPVAGSLALKTQTSPLYVVENDDVDDESDDDVVTEIPESEDEPKDAPEPETESSVLTLEWLVEKSLWLEEDLSEVITTLEGSSPQVMLAGPPGTGKSWVAQAIARYLTGDRATRWKLVQFHPSYGYESFIEGLRPELTDDGINFDVVPGAVVRLSEAARKYKQSPHVMIIDELNRANIPRVLGELMFLFEYRDQKIDLQHSVDFDLPDNLAFIATMNTADRSIRSIDVALRRRFEIYECLPDIGVLRRFYDHGLGVNNVPDLFDGFEALNQALEAELDRHHTIGQTFFMAQTMSPDRLRRVWTRKIFPLIEEYFFDQPDLAAELSIQKFWPSVGQ